MIMAHQGLEAIPALARAQSLNPSAVNDARQFWRLWKNLRGGVFGVQQQAEVIYLQKRAFDGKFGSKQPYQFRDKDFGMVNLRVFGEFRYKIAAPENFVNQFVGTFNFATSAEVST